MNRTYRVISPQTDIAQNITGSFSFGAFDAAKSYCDLYLPEYSVIPGGKPYPAGRMFEAVNHSAQLGAVLYVREI